MRLKILIDISIRSNLEISVQIVRYKKLFLEQKQNYSYHSLQLNLMDCASEKDYNFFRLQNSIPDDIVYEDEGKPEDPHVTLLYGLINQEDYFRLRNDIPDLKDKINFTIGPITSFRDPNKPFDVLVCSIKSEDCHDINTYIRNNYRANISYPDYHPHMTLAYLKKGMGKEYEGYHDWSGANYTSNVVQFAHKDKYHIPIPLS